MRALWRMPTWILPLLCGAALVLLPQLGVGPDLQRQVILTCILALLVSGLNLSLGYAGELAMGGAAVYAVGAYTAGYLGAHGHTEILLQLAASALVALVIGLISGIPGLRLGSWSLAMTSFFLILLVPDLIALFPDQTGGRIGLTGIEAPTIFGHALGKAGFYVFVTVVTVAWFAVMRNLVTSRHGVAFQVLRQSRVLAASEGISVFRLKLTAYALGGIPAGLAGALFANLDLYISPTTFDFSLAIAILAASILGGSTSVYGAFVGAAIMQFGPMQSVAFQKYALVVYGIFLVVGGVLLSGGLAGLMRAILRRLARRWPPPGRSAAPSVRDQEGPAAPVDRMPGGELVVSGVDKHFSGLRALSGVSLTARPGEVTALIGPNGSGKTTLLNIICGFYRADAGTVTLAGAAPTLRPHLMARAGVSRTFQTPLVPSGLTVAEAVASGRYIADRSGMFPAVFRLPGYRKVARADRDEVARVLDLVGIAERSGDPAASLPLGTRRLLEVARALISRPQLLLLDEAASGLDESEVDQLARLIRRIRDAGGTVVLVEHNFQMVLSLADRITVLAQGRVLAQGTPEQIEHDPHVLQEYLGVKGDAQNDAVAGDLATLRAEVES